jgi:hypothetical protein
MMSVPIFSAIALLLVLLYKKWEWISPEITIAFTHAILGIITIFFSFFQVLN